MTFLIMATYYNDNTYNICDITYNDITYNWFFL